MTTYPNSYQECLDADSSDPLASVRQSFVLPDGLIYLDGNSLGPMAKGVSGAIERATREEWGADLIASWSKAGWFEAPLRLGKKLEQVLGVDSQDPDNPSLVVTDTISLNLFKLVVALEGLTPNRPKALVEAGAFPTDRYMISGALGADRVIDLDSPEALEAALDEDVGLVVLSHVDYRSGYRWDMARTTELIHAKGARVIWDLAHSAGAMDIELSACGVDAAVGCTYKYLNGGPGSQAFVYIRPELANQVTQPLSGWWGHADPFAMDPSYRPAKGAKRFLSGTQAMLSMAALEAALDNLESVDWAQVRDKSVALCAMFAARVSQIDGIEVAGPTDPERRGSHVSVTFSDAYALVQALIARGVVGDFREPNFARFGLAPLILSYADVWKATEHLSEVVQTREWDQPAFFQRSAVT